MHKLLSKTQLLGLKSLGKVNMNGRRLVMRLAYGIENSTPP
jgi:hypothetical protein